MRNNYSRDKNICAYCHTNFFGFYCIRLSFHPSTSSFLFVIYVRPIYVYIQFASAGRGGWRFLLTWLPQLSCSISLSLFLLSFLLLFSSHTDSAVYLIVYSPFLFSSPFLFTSVVTAFLYFLLSRVLSHYDSLRLLCAYTMVDLRPPYFCCLKIHPFPRLCISCSCRFLFDSPHPPLYRICYLISVSLSASFFISFVFLPLSLSRFILSHLTLPSPRSPSPSVSACSNMATRCPITRLVLATVFPS